MTVVQAQEPPGHRLVPRVTIYSNHYVNARNTKTNGIPGVGGIDKYSTSVFLEKILRHYYIPTIGVVDLQAPLNNMLRRPLNNKNNIFSTVRKYI